MTGVERVEAERTGAEDLPEITFDFQPQRDLEGILEIPPEKGLGTGPGSA
jgi:hypothetical protein